MHFMKTAVATLAATAAAQATSQATVSIAPNTTIQATVRIDITHSTFGSSNDTEQNTHSLQGPMHITMSPNNPPWANIGQDSMNLALGGANYNFAFFCFPFIGCQNLNVNLASVVISMTAPAASPLSGTGNYTMSNVPVNLHAEYSTSGIDTGSYVLDQPAVVKRILAPPCRHRGRFSGWLRKRLQSLRIRSGCPKSRRSAGRGRGCFRRNSVTPGCLWSWMLATRTPANRFLMGCLPAIGQRSCRRKCRIPACRPRGGVLQQPNVQPAPGRGRISLSVYKY